jgi:RNA polymerase sigma-70 factor, ECF subfamily
MLRAPELVWLLAAVGKGDRAAFARLYQATCAKLYGVALRTLRRPDLANEVVQEAYLKIWNMVAIARNRAIDLVRKTADVSIEEDPAAMEAAIESVDPLAKGDMSEELKRLLACLGRLDQENRHLILLAYYSGWSRDRLAERFGMPVNSVKTRLRRALSGIRECLGT